jgi:hypothetical protein
MKREEAVTLLKELSAAHLIRPFLVLIEQRKPERYQLCIKGDYDRSELESFLQKCQFAIEENLSKGLLCIFKP